MSEKAFNYRGEELYVEDVSVSAVAETFGTPQYVYSAKAIRDNFRAYKSALQGRSHLIAYSVKAASNLSILRLIREEGGGADIVSGGELARALRAGIDPAKIVFSGVGKTAAEMSEALAAGVLTFNVESAPELDLLSAVAKNAGRIAPVALRVNPDVDPKTHP
jgi:diaminopimelate decarboxylase